MTALEQHLQKYPLMETTDKIKLLYQAHFGGGHLITDPTKTLARLVAEMETATGDMPLFEDIGQGMRRMHLAPLKKTALSPETANAMFVYGANHVKGDRAQFEAALNALSDRDAVAQYKQSGCPAVSHSPQYRSAYAPAYRVVPGIFEALFPLLERIDVLRSKGKSIVLGIEGMAASGKSTVSEILKELYGANLIHADDFFVPFAQKTEQRKREIGGNIDYVRMKEEVFVPLAKGEVFSYRPFDCSKQCLAQPVRVEKRRLTIVEGAYCTHPYFDFHYDILVFSAIDPILQRERILRRNGEKMLCRFENEWIPMENAFHEKTCAREKSDLILNAREMAELRE